MREMVKGWRIEFGPLRFQLLC